MNFFHHGQGTAHLNRKKLASEGLETVHDEDGHSTTFNYCIMQGIWSNVKYYQLLPTAYTMAKSYLLNIWHYVLFAGSNKTRFDQEG